MRTLFKPVLYIGFIALFFSCGNSDDSKQNQKSIEKISLSYAKRFAIKKAETYTILELFGNRNDSDVTATFVLYKDQKPNFATNAYYIKTPVTKIASMSSIYTTMLEQLGSRASVAAIDNIDYYSNSYIQEQVSKKEIKELSKGPKIDIEQTLALKPDLMLTFGMGNPKGDVDEKLLQANLPVAISLDHLEETPLARYEWIKFVASFVGKERLADSLFQAAEKRYNNLKDMVAQKSPRPTVLTEMKYGDVWYVPAGNSYMSHLISDAGADYLWRDNQNEGSTPLSFESVYAKAKDCDYWINTYNMNSKKELLSHDERYGLFKAFRENKIYNNNKTQNSKGYSDYWEQGIIRPDEVLADLIFIFHPETLPNHSFSFYKKIE